MLSFGGSGDKLLGVASNEDLINNNYWNLYYLTGAGTDSYPTSVKAYYIGSGLYIINGITNDPLNNNITYIFYTNLNVPALRVLSVDFSINKWNYIILSLGSSS